MEEDLLPKILMQVTSYRAHKCAQVPHMPFKSIACMCNLVGMFVSGKYIAVMCACSSWLSFGC